MGGFDVVSQLQSVFSTVGYCPQTDPLIDWMTAREALALYGALKHMAPADAHDAAEALITRLGLRPHAARPTAAYSGGNKRKTSLAIALLGSPAVIFLDEPSSGMDPLARRHMWDVLSQEARRRAIVLTSHSMEECEALCHRVGVISAGRLRCLGGLQRLKSRFGGGYVLELKCAPGRVDDVRAFVARTFGASAHLDEYHGTKLKYVMDEATAPEASGGARGGQLAAMLEAVQSNMHAVGMPGATASAPKHVQAPGEAPGGQLASIFEAVQAHMHTVGIVEYAASQPTLEQVFLQLARADGTDAVDEKNEGGSESKGVEVSDDATVPRFARPALAARRAIPARLGARLAQLRPRPQMPTCQQPVGVTTVVGADSVAPPHGAASSAS